MEGMLSLPATERDLLAMAANEMVGGSTSLHAPYADQFGGGSAAGENAKEDPRGPDGASR